MRGRSGNFTLSLTLSMLDFSLKMSYFVCTAIPRLPRGLQLVVSQEIARAWSGGRDEQTTIRYYLFRKH
jgi:hypothetical protein